MKKIRKFKFNFFNITMLLVSIVCVIVLVHDFIFWGVIPMFSGVFYQITYFGLFLDVLAIGLLEMSIQFIKEWF